jgi:hypothetical protein
MTTQFTPPNDKVDNNSHFNQIQMATHDDSPRDNNYTRKIKLIAAMGNPEYNPDDKPDDKPDDNPDDNPGYHQDENTI